MDLFDNDPPPPRERDAPAAVDPSAPLAERMRPRTLDDIVGQDGLLAPGRPLREAIGTRNVPPMAPRSAFQLKGLAVPSRAITPDAPNAAAVLTIAPTLPGSCSEARTSTSGRSDRVDITTRTSAGRARAMATTPDGCCTGLIAARI